MSVPSVGNTIVADAQMITLSGQLKTKVDAQVSMTSRIAQLTGQVNALNARTTTLTGQNAALKTAIAARIDTLNASGTNAAAVNADSVVRTNTATYKNNEASMASMASVITSLNTNIAQANTQLTVLNTDIAALNTQIEARLTTLLTPST
jgi:chromosome segregation ATPase